MRTLSVLILSILLSTTCAAASCTASSQANFSFPAPYWCQVDVTLLLQSACTVAVVERITVPWTTTRLSRVLPHQRNQRIIDVSTAFDQTQVSVPFAVSRLPDGVSTTITIFTTAARASTRFKLSYTVIPGIVTFSPCGAEDSRASPDSVAANFPDIPSHPSHQFVMLARWMLGGMSVSVVHNVSLAIHTPSPDEINSFAFLDVSTILPQNVLSLSSSSADSTAPVVAHLVGNVTQWPPARVGAFVRTVANGSRMPCAGVRDCEEERDLVWQNVERPARRSGVVIVVVAVAAVVVAVVTLAVVWYVRSKWGDDDDEDDELNAQNGGGDGPMSAALPQSLQHFAFDTGDEVSSKKWREWNEAPSPSAPTGTAERQTEV